ncbi:MAG: AI-2E family transporter [Oscillospiraceae bacterium]|nr:AI-2E family transporter [Oscillospiraceae bacterium]
MRRQFHWDKKYLNWGMTAFCVIAASILFYMALRFLPALGKAIGGLVGILSPFIWGLAISYLLAPLMRTLESSLFKPLGQRLYRNNKKKDGSRFARGIAVLVSELILLVVLTALIYLILPQLYSSIEMIALNSPTYLMNLSEWVTGLLKNMPQVEEYISNALGTVNSDIVGWLTNTLLPSLGSFLTNVTAGVYYVLRAVYNLIIGIIVSVYILSNLEGFKAAALRLLYSVFSIEAADWLRRGVAFTDRTFMGFINGKLLDSAIIGLICYIVCAILNMPYALLVSVIVGVTNVIPFFGPLIGAIPSAIIILMVSPFKCLIFVIFVILLQQVDGNIIGPKILGNSIGINGFWVMFSIILGAGLFGFWGMLLGVPVFVVLYTLVEKLIQRKLKRSDLPTETSDYVDLAWIDPVTRQAV